MVKNCELANSDILKNNFESSISFQNQKSFFKPQTFTLPAKQTERKRQSALQNRKF